MEGLVRFGQLVRSLCGFVAREDAFLAPVTSRNIDPPALHEMTRKTHTVLVTQESSFRKAGIKLE